MSHRWRGGSPPVGAGTMCDKCAELEKKIEHYERIRSSINDQLTVDRIKELVERMRTQKAALHPGDVPQ